MNSILDFLTTGGPLMIPLGFCSVLMVAVIIERIVNLRLKRIIAPEVVQLVETIRNPEDLNLSLAILDKNPGSLSTVIRSAIENRDLAGEELRNLVRDVGHGESKRIERGQIVLEAIAGIAPLLGLLGTVVGMIRVFRVIASVGVGDANALSAGISEALITTAVGLSIAIPALAAYHFFSSRIEEIVLEMERVSSLLLAKLRTFGGRA
ncbi:MAG: MotA/TolQ/ExbB proton channel family protein [Gemmatimonadetes bacterium]|nr:MotA/TolQ/ExbB proton channel family protein [Gemmatimonadota bacterium]